MRWHSNLVAFVMTSSALDLNHLQQIAILPKLTLGDIITTKVESASLCVEAKCAR